jgi:hypothetical protein
MRRSLLLSRSCIPASCTRRSSPSGKSDKHRSVRTPESFELLGSAGSDESSPLGPPAQDAARALACFRDSAADLSGLWWGAAETSAVAGALENLQLSGLTGVRVWSCCTRTSSPAARCSAAAAAFLCFSASVLANVNCRQEMSVKTASLSRCSQSTCGDRTMNEREHAVRGRWPAPAKE